MISSSHCQPTVLQGRNSPAAKCCRTKCEVVPLGNCFPSTPLNSKSCICKAYITCTMPLEYNTCHECMQHIPPSKVVKPVFCIHFATVLRLGAFGTPSEAGAPRSGYTLPFSKHHAPNYGVKFRFFGNLESVLF